MLIPGLVSVVLVNFRGVDDTLACIEGLAALDWPDHLIEVIVVDNASGDDSVARLRELGQRIVLIESSENLGFAGGCNLGVGRARGEFVAFLNNDARPDAGWVRAAVACFASGQDIGAVASKVLDWEGRTADFVDASLTWYGMGYKAHTGETDLGKWDEGRDVLFGTGAAMFVRASVFRELGGFDEDYFMFYEDVDLGWRINLAGYRVRYHPQSLAFHRHHASMSAFGAYHEDYLLERNALFTLYKNLEDASLTEVLAPALLLAARRSVRRGDLDSTSLDLRSSTGRDDPEVSVPKSALTSLFAMDRFVEELPRLSAKRRSIQSSRRVSDRHIKLLFGNTDEPAYPDERYLRGYESLVDAFGGMSPGGRRRVLIVTGDPIGAQMAGPAIRAWNMAWVLSGDCDVRIVSSSRAVASGTPFEVGRISKSTPKSAEAHEEWADVIVVQGHALEHFPAFEHTTKPLVVDVYDPMHLEQLEQARDLPLNRWNERVLGSNESLNHQLLLGDFFLAASERQRHFWLGQLAALGRVNAHNYARDDSLESLVAVVPFGISDTDPVQTRPALRGVVPGIGKTDKIVIWAGGIYNWFDPETLVLAIQELAARRPDVRLFFLGVRHPNPDVPEMEAVTRTRVLAARLGLDGVNVFFNDSWVDYEDRQNYLLEADAGVSTHFEHIETTFSFRTRILDYLWAGLPIVSTDGDPFAELIRDHDLGVVVPERNASAIADALERVLYDSDESDRMRANIATVRESFRWSRVLRPLARFVEQPSKAADRTGDGSKRSTATSLAIIGASASRSRHTGVRRDVDRVVYYLKNGGVSAVLDRYRARRERLAAAKKD